MRTMTCRGGPRVPFNLIKHELSVSCLKILMKEYPELKEEIRKILYLEPETGVMTSGRMRACFYNKKSMISGVIHTGIETPLYVAIKDEVTTIQSGSLRIINVPRKKFQENMIP